MIIKLGLVIYACIAMFHLVAAFKENNLLRKISKPFLTGTLFISFLIYMIVNKKFDIHILLALFCGLVGDIILLFQGKKLFFAIGGVSFFIGFVLYIVKMILWMPFTFGWYFYLILIVSIGLWCLLTYNKFKPYLKQLTVCCSIYSFILLVGIALSLSVILVAKSKFSIMVSLGFMLFVLSDAILVYSVFIKKIKRSHFYLMIPYILAQACISVGLFYL